MSLYADYVKERTDDHILEGTNGFATYRYLSDGKTVYIIDIYTAPGGRQMGMAAALADLICQEARAKGCTELLGTVVPSTKGSTTSIQVLIGYGMKLKGSSDNLIVFRKDL